MKIIRLNSNRYILYTSEGVHTISVENIYFNKIIRLISNGTKEEEILPLLKPQNLPDGLYKAYLNASGHLYYTCTTNTTTQHTAVGYSEKCDQSIDQLLGVYATVVDITLDWPEHFI